MEGIIEIMSMKDQIIRVYKRKVMAHPEGAVVHMGDCHIYNSYLGVCTCGLHHWLMQAGEEVVQEVYPNLNQEETQEVFIEYLLQEFELNKLYVKEDGKFNKVEKPEPLSEEEVRKAIDEIKKEWEWDNDKNKENN